MKSQPTEPPEQDKEREILLKQFRAYLHLAITAHQTGQKKQLEAMPGPNVGAYCMELVELPDNTLAWELAASVTAILDQISQVSCVCEGTLRRKDEKSVAMHAMAKRILDQLDLSIGFILRSLNTQLWFRGEVTKDTDFLCEAMGYDTKAGGRIARMARRYQRLHPHDIGQGDSFVEPFAWDVYQRVTELDKLADEFPGLVRHAARRMHAWPMLMHRHTNSPVRAFRVQALLRTGDN